MRAPGLRAAVLSLSTGLGCGGGGSLARSERSMPSTKLLSMVATSVFLLGLVGCMGSQKACQIVPLAPCTSNCPPPPTPAAEFLYATSNGHILAFTINQTSGALSAPLVATGPNESTGMAALAPDFLYVSDFLNDTVDGFSIDSTSGGLSVIAGSPFSLGGTPPGAGGLGASAEGGAFLYATDLNAGEVDGFLFDPGSGMLTPVPGSPFAAGNTPVQAAQAQGFLYVSNLNDSAGAISAFTIDANGSLSPVPGSPFPTGAPGSFPGPSAMVVSVNSNFLYVALAGTSTANNQIAAFAIDATTGSLTALPGSPFSTGNDPLQMAYVPVTASAEGFLYTANVQDGTISAFTADDNSGVLTPVSGSPYAAGTSVGGLAASLTFTSTGAYFLYAADPEAMTVTAYTIDGSTGALSPLPGSPFPAAGNAPMVLTVTIP